MDLYDWVFAVSESELDGEISDIAKIEPPKIQSSADCFEVSAFSFQLGG